MREIIYVIKDTQGIHARPAGQLAKLASMFKSVVNAATDSKTSNAKSITSLMLLQAKQGTKLKITCQGDDEDAAISEIESFLNANL